MAKSVFWALPLTLAVLGACTEQPQQTAQTGLETRIPTLTYSIVGREDISYASTPRMVFRVVFHVDEVPTEQSLRKTVESIWAEGNKHWKVFTIFGYLPDMDTKQAAYVVVEFNPDGLEKFQIQDFSLWETKWQKKAEQEAVDDVRAPKTGSQSQIVCNEFSPKVAVRDDVLELSLDTDLPDYTQLMISVSRSYMERASDDKYPLDYFSEKTTVGKWRDKHSIDISEGRWLQTFNGKVSILKKIGEWSGLASVSEVIEISFTVPINQTNPAFGERNSNLVGDKVTVKSGLRVVEAEEQIKHPLKQKP